MTGALVAVLALVLIFAAPAALLVRAINRRSLKATAALAIYVVALSAAGAALSRYGVQTHSTVPTVGVSGQ